MKGRLFENWLRQDSKRNKRKIFVPDKHGRKKSPIFCRSSSYHSAIKTINFLEAEAEPIKLRQTSNEKVDALLRKNKFFFRRKISLNMLTFINSIFCDQNNDFF
jgi:hypothetical protein